MAAAAPPHAAYLHALNETARGVLNAKTNESLSLEAANVACTLSTTHATLLCRYEFKSYEMTTVATFAALEVPATWQILSFTAELPSSKKPGADKEIGEIAATKLVRDTGNTSLPYSSFLQQNPTATAAANEDENKKMVLLTAAIPYHLHPGQCLDLSIVYLVPLLYSTANAVRLQLPLSKLFLSPEAGSVAKKDANGQSEWKAAFQVDGTRKMPSGASLLVTGGALLAAQPIAFTVKLEQPNKPIDVVSQTVPEDDKSKEEDLIFVDVSEKDNAGKLAGELTLDIMLRPADAAIHTYVFRQTDDEVEKSQDSAWKENEQFLCLVSLAPLFEPAQLAAPNVELIVAIDGSRSMAAYASAAQDAIRVLLAGLPPSVFLNVVALGAEAEWLWADGSRPLSPAAGAEGAPEQPASETGEVMQFVRAACIAQHAESRLAAGLRDVYARPTIHGYVRVVLLISDGHDSTAPSSGATSPSLSKTVEMCTANRFSTRLCTVAAGPIPHIAFLKQLAAASNGVFRSTDGNDANLVGAALACASAALVPTLVNASLQFVPDEPGEDPDAPILRPTYAHIPAIPHGERVFLPCFATGKRLTAGTVICSGTVAGDHLDYKYHTGPITHQAGQPNVTDASVLHLFSAESYSRNRSRKHVQFAVEHVAAASSRIRTLIDANPKSALLEVEAAEVTHLSQGFSVLTPLTAMKYSHPKWEKDAALEGEGGAIPSVLAPFRSLKDRSKVAPAPIVRDAAGAAVPADSPAAVFTSVVPGAPARTEDFMRSLVLQKIVDPLCMPPKMLLLLVEQQVDGSWAGPTAWRLLHDLTSSTSGHELQKLQPEGTDENTWCTAIALVLLQRDEEKNQAKSPFDNAVLAKKKALAFLHDQDAAIDAARKLFA